MKKILVVLLCAVIVFGCSGCGILLDALLGDEDADFEMNEAGKTEAVTTAATESEFDLAEITEIGSCFIDAFAKNDGAKAAEYVDRNSELYDLVTQISVENRVEYVTELTGMSEYPEMYEMVDKSYRSCIEEAGITSADANVSGDTVTVTCDFLMPDKFGLEGNMITISNAECIGCADLQFVSGEWRVVSFVYYDAEELESSENGEYFPGYNDEKTYASYYLGLSVELENDWFFFTRENLNYLAGYPETFLVDGNTEGIENYVAFTEAFAYRQVGDTYEEFIITMEKESDYTSGLPLEERIAISMGAIEEGYAAAYEDYYWEEISIECGSREFPGVYVELFDGQNYTYKLMFLLDCGEYTATFEITKFTSDFESELAMIYELE